MDKVTQAERKLSGLCQGCGEKECVVIRHNYGLFMPGGSIAYDEAVDYCLSCFHKNERKIIEAEWKLAGACQGCGVASGHYSNKIPKCSDCITRERIRKEVNG